MKKERILFLTAALVLLTVCFSFLFAFSASADETADASLDLNKDGVVDVKDVNYLLNSIAGSESQTLHTPEDILTAAYDLNSGDKLIGTYTLTGTVLAVSANYDAGDTSVWIQIGDDFERPVYCLYLNYGDALGDNDVMEEGALVTVTGKLGKFGDCVYFEDGCTLDAFTPAEKPQEQENAAELIEKLLALPGGMASLDERHTLTGTVSEITSAYDRETKTISFRIVVDGYTIHCPELSNGSTFRQNEGIAVVKVGDVVKVNGVLCKFKNGKDTIIFFDSDCTLEELRPAEELPTTPEEIVEAAYALKPGEKLYGSFTLSGQVSEISDMDGLTLKIVVGDMNDKPLICTNIQIAGGATVNVGDEVTVTGAIANVNGAIGFTGCELRIKSTGVVDEDAHYETLDELCDRLELTYGLPSTGDVEILVIPIGFSNSKYSNVSQTLEKGFNGTAADTGWYSLSSYYSEVSGGKLNIHATITDVYQTGARYNLSRGKTGSDDYKYLTDALNYFKDRYDYTKYDLNNDGYLDCVYLVYLAPYMTSESHSDLWWAYTYEYFEEGEEVEIGGMKLDWYMWFSIDFFTQDIYVDDRGSDDLGVKINAETVIHETGHALGLDDYYDYVNEHHANGGLGALNMMDCNQGDHDPFSKAILGWINPTVLKSGSYERTITSFTSTGDAIFLAKEGNGTYFDEFYIISLYTPDGANALKAPYEAGLPNVPGVVIYHVNSTLASDFSEIYSALDIYAHNNGEKNDRLIKIVEADGDGSIDDGYYFDESDMFGSGSTLELKWNDGTSSFWTVSIGSVSADGAEISIIG